MISAALAWLNPYKWLAIGLVALALAGVIGGQHIRIGGLKNQLADKSAKLSAATERATQLDKEFRATEAAWVKEQKDAKDEAERKLTVARADAAIADAAAGRLRDRVAALIRQAREAAASPAIASGGTATDDPIGVLADVLGRADARAGLLAAEADKRGIAGQLCEQAYDALSNR